MSAAPQRERSDPPKVPRGFREQSQNSHHATTTDAHKVTGWLLEHELDMFDFHRGSQNNARTTNNEHWYLIYLDILENGKQCSP